MTEKEMFLRKWSSIALALVSTGGLVATTVLMYRQAPKIKKVVDEYKESENKNQLALVKNVAKPAAPVITAGTITVACIFGSGIINYRNQAALTGAYIFLNQQFKKHKDTVEKLFGETANDEVDHEIVKEKIQKVSLSNCPLSTEKVCFYEEHYGEIFEASMIEVMDAEYRLNKKLAKEGEANVNDFLTLLGLPRKPEGDRLGWSLTYELPEKSRIWIDFEHELCKIDDGLECYEIKILEEPEIDYDVPF